MSGATTPISLSASPSCASLVKWWLYMYGSVGLAGGGGHQLGDVVAERRDERAARAGVRISPPSVVNRRTPSPRSTLG